MKTPAPIFLTLSSFLLVLTATADAQITSHYCVDGTTYAPNSTFQTHLQTTLATLSAASESAKFSNATVSPVTAVYTCRYDLPISTCHTCVANATTFILRLCPSNTEAAIWYEQCTLTYSPRPIIGQILRPVPLFYSLGGRGRFLNTSDFNQTVVPTLERISGEATSNSTKYFATGEGTYSGFQRVYCLVQCSPDINATDCGVCLEKALNTTKEEWDGEERGMVFIGHYCEMRFGVKPFYELDDVVAPTLAPSAPPGGNSSATPAQANGGIQYGLSWVLLATTLLLCILNLEGFNSN